MSKNNRFRIRSMKFMESDLFSVVNHNAELWIKLENSIDKLDIEERDIFSMRHGILEYQTEGTKTFKKIAILQQKPLKTIWNKYQKIVVKLRSN